MEKERQGVVCVLGMLEKVSQEPRRNQQSESVHKKKKNQPGFGSCIESTYCLFSLSFGLGSIMMGTTMALLNNFLAG